MSSAIDPYIEKSLIRLSFVYLHIKGHELFPYPHCTQWNRQTENNKYSIFICIFVCAFVQSGDWDKLWTNWLLYMHEDWTV